MPGDERAKLMRRRQQFVYICQSFKVCYNLSQRNYVLTAHEKEKNYAATRRS